MACVARGDDWRVNSATIGARVLFSVGVVAVVGCAPRVTPSTQPAVPAMQTPMRVHHVATGRTVSFDYLVAAAAGADVVFFGEQHDDPETHFAEFALLEGIGRIRPHVVLSLEMFERDVQPLLDDYLAGRIAESDFLAASRPWERYATDYRALVVLARARGWPVIAANVPRPIASAVSRRGLAALDTLPAASRAWVARDLSCPKDDYYARFAEEMKGHSAGTASAPPSSSDSAAAIAMTDRFYQAQCVKDETMGESIARARERAGSNAIVVHFNGSFHSDYGLGTAERARRRMPGTKQIVITAIPVATPASGLPTDHARRGDFLVFTQRAARR
jgi:uncharacterized iron-regulated protein